MSNQAIEFAKKHPVGVAAGAILIFGGVFLLSGSGSHASSAPGGPSDAAVQAAASIAQSQAQAAAAASQANAQVTGQAQQIAGQEFIAKLQSDTAIRTSTLQQAVDLQQISSAEDISLAQIGGALAAQFSNNTYQLNAQKVNAGVQIHQMDTQAFTINNAISSSAILQALGITTNANTQIHLSDNALTQGLAGINANVAIANVNANAAWQIANVNANANVKIAGEKTNQAIAGAASNAFSNLLGFFG